MGNDVAVEAAAGIGVAEHPGVTRSGDSWARVRRAGLPGGTREAQVAVRTRARDVAEREQSQRRRGGGEEAKRSDDDLLLGSPSLRFGDPGMRRG